MCDETARSGFPIASLDKLETEAGKENPIHTELVEVCDL